MSTSMTYLAQELEKQMKPFTEIELEAERQKLKKAQNDWENAEYLLNAMDDADYRKHCVALSAAQLAAEKIMEESPYFLGEHNELIKKEP